MFLHGLHGCIARVFAWLHDSYSFGWLHSSYGLHVVDFFFIFLFLIIFIYLFFFFFYLFIYLFFGHEETGRHLFGRKTNRILKREEIVFLEG